MTTLALFAVAIAGGVFWLLRQSPAGLDRPEEVTRRHDPMERSPSDVDPLVTQSAEVPPPKGARAAGAADDEPESLALTLRAIDAQTGARVMRFWVRASGFGDLASDVRRWRSDPATGEATVELEASPHGPFIPLSVLADRYLTHDFTPESGSHAVARLERATSIVGTVRDADSAPVVSARVDLIWYGEESGPGAEPLEPPDGVATLRRSDENGEYAFTKLPPGRWATRVTVGGVERSSSPRFARYGEWTRIDHWIDEGRRIVADVIQPSGAPSPDSRVLISKEDAEPPLLARYSDSDGRVILGPLEPGAYVVTVVSDHGAHDPIDVVVPSDSSRTGSRTTHVRFRLQ